MEVGSEDSLWVYKGRVHCGKTKMVNSWPYALKRASTSQALSYPYSEKCPHG